MGAGGIKGRGIRLWAGGVSLAKIETVESKHGPEVRELITQMPALDSRPTSQRRAAPFNAPESEGKRFAFRLLDYDIQWEVRRGGLYVVDVLQL